MAYHGEVLDSALANQAATGRPVSQRSKVSRGNGTHSGLLATFGDVG
jgi:hypothetical protein